MAKFVLSCCSSSDLSLDYMEKRNVRCIYFHIEIDGVDYPDDMGKTVPHKELFKRMAEGAMTKTSQVTLAEYFEYFKDLLSKGNDVLHVTLSSGLSGTYNSAVMAANEVQEMFPSRKIYVVDSLGASTGYGHLIDKLCDLRDEDMNLEDAYKWIEEHKLNMHHWFFSTDLTYFIRGGRVSKTAGTIGNILNICPLLNVDNEGHLIPRENIRTKKKVIQRIVEKMEAHAEGGLDYSGKVFLSHSDCYEDARAVADLIEEKFTKMDGKVNIYPIGGTIGSHTGPGTVAIFFWGDKRED